MSHDALAFVIGHDHPALPGHFPGRPVVPGVVVLDRVLAAIQAQGGATGALALPQVKFVQPLLPGQAARIELVPVAPPASGAADAAPRWRFRVLRGDALIASGEVRAA